MVADDIREHQYDNMESVWYDLRKLTGEKDLIRDVPELNYQQTDVIQASSHGGVPFTPRISAVFDTTVVRTLGTVTQLGLVSLVYPTATHSRLEHTVGTFAMSCEYVRALCSDPVNPIFRQIMGAEDIEALLLAALLHDIGHYPLAHDLEEVHPTTFGHSDRTTRLLRGDAKLRKLIDEGNQWLTDLQRINRVLRASDDPRNATFRDCILSAIIDGPIDADKLDYLIRDSENLRVPYGRGIDAHRLISSITVVVVPDHTDPRNPITRPMIGVHERGKMAAEKSGLCSACFVWSSLLA
jgi:HD superfamily phosphohydrolase